MATRITTQEVKQRMDRGEQVQFVDSRNPQAWSAAQTKLPDATRVPADEAERHITDIGRDRLVVTYCT